MMTTSSIHKFSLPSSIDSIAKVEQIVENLREAAMFSEEIYGNILVSLTEAVNNAAKHGNKYREDKTVNLEYIDGQTEYIFTVEDQGSGFDYNNIPDPTLPENLEKLDGRGIFIIKNLADKIEFENSGKTMKIYFNKV